jgi:hypothetical protein
MSRDRRHRPTPLRARGLAGRDTPASRLSPRPGSCAIRAVRYTSMVCGCAAGRLCRLPRECCLAAGATVRLPTREQPAAAPQAAAAAPRRDCLIRCMAAARTVRAAARHSRGDRPVVLLRASTSWSPRR